MQNPDSFADGVHHFILLKALEAGPRLWFPEQIG